MKKIVLIAALSLLIISQSIAQLKLTAELRPRGEYRSGYQKILLPDDKAAFFISQRTRLSAYYKTGNFDFGLSFQDVRVWGDEGLYSSTGVFGDYASLDLNEAWMSIKLYEKGSLKAGRQFWIIDDERIIASRTWNQSQIKYDALLYQHMSEKIEVNLGMSWNSSLENLLGNEYPDDKMKTLNFLRIRKPLNDWLDVSAIAIASGFMRDDTSEVIIMQGTYGVYLNIKKEGLTAILNGYYQNGNSRYKSTSSAWMFSAKGDYKFSKVSIGAGIDWLSGNDAKKTDPSYQEKDHFFDILYGVRHRYYGHLDYFNNMRKATSAAGLVDPYLKFRWWFVPAASLNADFHYFWLHGHLENPGFEPPSPVYLSRALGPEIDLNISWDINKFINLKGGYSMMFPTKTMNILQGNDPDNARKAGWAWIMLTATPVLLDTSQK